MLVSLVGTRLFEREVECKVVHIGLGRMGMEVEGKSVFANLAYNMRHHS